MHFSANGTIQTQTVQSQVRTSAGLQQHPQQQQAQQATVVPNCKNLPKIKPKKLVKLIDHTNVYNSLTNFEYQVNKMTVNNNSVKMLKFAWKNSGNHFR